MTYVQQGIEPSAFHVFIQQDLDNKPHEEGVRVYMRA